MKKVYTAIYSVILVGLLGAVIRGFELKNVFDFDTQLPKANHPISLILIGLSIIIAIILFLAVPRGKKSEQDGENSGISSAAILVEMIAIAAFAVSVIYTFYDFGDKILFRESASSIVSLFVFGILGILSVIGMLLTLFAMHRKTLSKEHGFWLTIPIFWGCYNLILDFWTHASNSILISYAYSMFSFIMLTLVLYSSASFFFIKNKQNHTKFYGLLCIYFSILVLGGIIIAQFVTFTDEGGYVKPIADGLFFARFQWGKVSVYLFAIFHSIFLILAATSGAFKITETAEPVDADENQADLPANDDNISLSEIETEYSFLSEDTAEGDDSSGNTK